ncbi:hypothetical protein BDV29DRAFT_10297 [Aspergillus leporis]|uniref:Uncharacterized protein n=1 Tax=Aspergillus leporis TaxID=41062 RepID=A0A5N5WXK4_9EURO|nr:hypothetical protein BDV29DRAFT_10297 [Aspergillus leporis]
MVHRTHPLCQSIMHVIIVHSFTISYIVLGMLSQSHNRLYRPISSHSMQAQTRHWHNGKKIGRQGWEINRRRSRERKKKERKKKKKNRKKR